MKRYKAANEIMPNAEVSRRIIADADSIDGTADNPIIGIDKNMKSEIAVATCVVLLSLVFDNAFSQDTNEGLAEVIESYSNAKLQEPIPPRFPSRALRDGREGWVILSYIVTAEGTISEPMIEDSSGHQDFERAALKMLDRWEYEPALLNGDPVDQSLTNYRVLFRIEGGTAGASHGFRKEFKEIEDLITAGELDQAEERIFDLRYKSKHNLYEDAWFWWLNYKYLSALSSDNTNEKISSLRKAIGYEEFYLPPDVLVYAFLELFVLRVQIGNYSGAVATFDRLQNSKEAKRSDLYEEVLSSLQPAFDKILVAIDGDQILPLDARVGENGYWVHGLIRKSFALGEVSGRLEVVDIRCRSHTMQYSISESSTWKIPESWEYCGVYIKGDEGTTFTFYELPDEKDEPTE